MSTKHPQYIAILLFAIGLTITLGACTKQAWYEGAKSSQKVCCMNEPISEYENCMQQSAEDYDAYSKNREALLKETQRN